MIIKKIKLENFKSHKNTEINLFTGINTIMGHNGSGKTSILEAISFALFKQYTSKKIDDLIKTGSKKMAVELTFVVNGQTYQVKRERTGSSKATLKVLEEGTFAGVVSGDKQVTDEIQNLLEMDKDLFLNSVYVQQGEIADLIDKTPAEKKEIIGRLLGIDSLERAWRNMKLITEKYEDESLKLEGKLESFTDLGTEITTKQEQITELQDTIKEVKASSQEAITAYEEVKEKKNVMDEKAIQAEVISSKIVTTEKSLIDTVAGTEDLEHEVELFENNEKELEEIKPQLKKISELKSLKERIEDLQTLKLEKSRLEAECNDIKILEKVVADTEKNHNEIPGIEKDIEIIKNQIQEGRTEISNLRVKNQSLDKPIKELEEVKDSCPICKSSITETKRDELLNEYKSELSQNRELIKLLLEENEGSQKTLTKYESALKAAKLDSEKYLSAKGALESLEYPDKLQSELDKIKTKISNDEHDIRKLKKHFNFSDIDKAISDLEALKQRSQTLEGILSGKEKTLQRLENNKQKISELESNSIELRKELDNLSYDKEAHLLLKDEWESKNRLVNGLSEKKHSLSGQLNQLETNLSELETKKATFKDTVDEQRKLKDFIKLLKFIRDVYGKDGVQRELRNLSRPVIEAKTRELFEKFNFDYSDIQLDSEYNITLHGPGGESALDMISGGEKIAVALALRLGITQVLSGNSLELILLDEPTVHLDSYRRQELVELLKRMSILPQMIIVTHDNDLAEAADNVLRISKDGGDSAIEIGGD